MRDKIIEKSTEMFLIRGSKGLTMDTIAYEMGISKKTIYKYFNTKRELVEAGSEYLFHKITDGIDKIIELNENPIKEIPNSFAKSTAKVEHAETATTNGILAIKALEITS